ncbi:MAG: bifunctional DNA-formamidopyrimidine glycosylase/DNA-(apurinic or apyrimidinic site) lyase [bacterium]|nr:bifunctional DNA-formamidopyrimidine glycosylase/DNA-(apurinic or apyrimidinic site) lyase [bacterium]
MPELPEVTTTATVLHERIRGFTIRGVWSSYNSVFHKGKNNIKNIVYFETFKKAIIGKKILRVRRRAKNVLIDLSGGISILVHMKMTGHLLYGMYRRNSKFETLNPKQTQNSKRKIQNEWEKEEWMPDEKKTSPLLDKFNRFIRLVINFSNGKSLVLSDMRKFAKVVYYKTSEENKIPDLDGLGPEPLEKSFKVANFKHQVRKKPNLPVKQVLMMPEIIAGIGNIYSDEMLWLSGIHPLCQSAKIPENALKKLFSCMRQVLKKGIKLSGDSMSDYRTPSGEKGGFQTEHRAYRRTGEKCPKKGCGGKIQRMKIGGRSAHFCDKHQLRY